MKEFFFSQNEGHLYSQDIKFAKFWQQLQPEEQDAFWI